MKKIALVGMMACGKTTLGKRLAENMDLPLVDVDAEVEREAGMSIADIFATYGEAEFRRLERAAIEKLLKEPGEAILSMGGGAFVQDGIRALLKDKAVSVYLRVSPDELVRRLEKTDTAFRPLLGESGDWRNKTLRLAGERDPLYMDADVIFPADGNDLEALGERLTGVMSSLCKRESSSRRLETAHA